MGAKQEGSSAAGRRLVTMGNKNTEDAVFRIGEKQDQGGRR